MYKWLCVPHPKIQHNKPRNAINALKNRRFDFSLNGAFCDGIGFACLGTVGSIDLKSLSPENWRENLEVAFEVMRRDLNLDQNLTCDEFRSLTHRGMYDKWCVVFYTILRLHCTRWQIRKITEWKWVVCGSKEFDTGATSVKGTSCGSVDPNNELYFHCFF